MRICIGMISLLVLILCHTVVACDSSPVDSVGVRNIKGERFVLYRVEQGQTWYGIAHGFGLSANDVQSANEDVKHKALSVGQIVLIPMNKEVPARVEMKTVEAGDGPIIYKVKKGETLYAVAVKNGQTMKDIRHWNNLRSDTLHAEQELIMGYKNGKIEKGKRLSVKADTAFVKPAEAMAKESKDEWKIPPSKVNNLEEHGMASFIEDEDINPHKYYALHRTAPKGTVIKVTNIMNKKQVYVKVVGTLPATGDNDNLIIKISKASAMKLGVLDSHFQVVLNYFGE